MAEVNRKFRTRQEMIQDVINCGKSIIDNAEQLVDNIKYLEGVEIKFTVKRSLDMPTYISKTSYFFAEDSIERGNIDKELKTEEDKNEDKKEDVSNDENA